jgi:hypothetical protein
MRELYMDRFNAPAESQFCMRADRALLPFAQKMGEKSHAMHPFEYPDLDPL